TITGVGVNPTRTGILRVLEAMGADIELLEQREAAGESVADIRVRGGELRGIDVPPEWVPLAIDEVPAIRIAAAGARGVTTIRGAAELRVKESDRIAAMAAGLRTLGIAVEEFADGMRITGSRIGEGTVDSFGDHRIAMAFAVASIGAAGPIRIRDCRNVATSFPDFVSIAARAGLAIDEVMRSGNG